MRNPWLKKNPFMSMWLSGANSMLGKARGQATAAVRRETNKAVSSATAIGTRQVLNFWSDMLKPPGVSRRRRSGH